MASEYSKNKSPSKTISCKVASKVNSFQAFQIPLRKQTSKQQTDSNNIQIVTISRNMNANLLVSGLKSQ
eukprot:c34271_g1_i1 orf=206-412(-)